MMVLLLILSPRVTITPNASKIKTQCVPQMYAVCNAVGFLSDGMPATAPSSGHFVSFVRQTYARRHGSNGMRLLGC